MDQTIDRWVEALAEGLISRGWHLATVESCTGGGIGERCTSIAGSSRWFNGGLVTYSNAAKSDLADVPESLIQAHGAVSRQVAAAMASGGARALRAEVSVAVTGVAGPGGGTPDKPVGLVWFGWFLDGAVQCESRRFEGDRESIRKQAVEYALQGVLERLPAA